jgi:hypothetical protein
MVSIAKEVETDPQLVLKAPHSTRTSRVDEVTAAAGPAPMKPGRTAKPPPSSCSSWP